MSWLSLFWADLEVHGSDIYINGEGSALKLLCPILTPTLTSCLVAPIPAQRPHLRWAPSDVASGGLIGRKAYTKFRKMSCHYYARSEFRSRSVIL